MLFDPWQDGNSVLFLANDRRRIAEASHTACTAHVDVRVTGTGCCLSSSLLIVGNAGESSGTRADEAGH